MNGAEAGRQSKNGQDQKGMECTFLSLWPGTGDVTLEAERTEIVCLPEMSNLASPESHTDKRDDLESLADPIMALPKSELNGDMLASGVLRAPCLPLSLTLVILIFFPFFQIIECFSGFSICCTFCLETLFPVFSFLTP